MNIKSHLAGLLITVVCLLVCTPLLFASDNQISRASLRGIEEIYVYVEPLGAEIEKLGLNGDIIQEDIIGKLKASGIKILSRDEWLREAGNPHLYVIIRVLGLTNTKEFIYSIDIAFRQSVYPVINPIEIPDAVTWSTGGVIGITPRLEKIRTSVIDQVDEFIHAFFSINPEYKADVKE